MAWVAGGRPAVHSTTAASTLPILTHSPPLPPPRYSKTLNLGKKNSLSSNMATTPETPPSSSSLFPSTISSPPPDLPPPPSNLIPSSSSSPPPPPPPPSYLFTDISTEELPPPPPPEIFKETSVPASPLYVCSYDPPSPEIKSEYDPQLPPGFSINSSQFLTSPPPPPVPPPPRPSPPPPPTPPVRQASKEDLAAMARFSPDNAASKVAANSRLPEESRGGSSGSKSICSLISSSTLTATYLQTPDSAVSPLPPHALRVSPLPTDATSPTSQLSDDFCTTTISSDLTSTPNFFDNSKDSTLDMDTPEPTPQVSEDATTPASTPANEMASDSLSNPLNLSSTTIAFSERSEMTESSKSVFSFGKRELERENSLASQDTLFGVNTDSTTTGHAIMASPFSTEPPSILSLPSDTISAEMESITTDTLSSNMEFDSNTDVDAATIDSFVTARTLETRLAYQSSPTLSDAAYATAESAMDSGPVSPAFSGSCTITPLPSDYITPMSTNPTTTPIPSPIPAEAFCPISFSPVPYLTSQRYVNTSSSQPVNKVAAPPEPPRRNKGTIKEDRLVVPHKTAPTQDRPFSPQAALPVTPLVHSPSQDTRDSERISSDSVDDVYKSKEIHEHQQSLDISTKDRNDTLNDLSIVMKYVSSETEVNSIITEERVTEGNLNFQYSPSGNGDLNFQTDNKIHEVIYRPSETSSECFRMIGETKERERKDENDNTDNIVQGINNEGDVISTETSTNSKCNDNNEIVEQDKDKCLNEDLNGYEDKIKQSLLNGEANNQKAAKNNENLVSECKASDTITIGQEHTEKIDISASHDQENNKSKNDSQNSEAQDGTNINSNKATDDNVPHPQRVRRGCQIIEDVNGNISYVIQTDQGRDNSETPVNNEIIEEMNLKEKGEEKAEKASPVLEDKIDKKEQSDKNEGESNLNEKCVKNNYIAMSDKSKGANENSSTVNVLPFQKLSPVPTPPTTPSRSSPAWNRSPRPYSSSPYAVTPTRPVSSPRSVSSSPLPTIAASIGGSMSPFSKTPPPLHRRTPTSPKRRSGIPPSPTSPKEALQLLDAVVYNLENMSAGLPPSPTLKCKQSLIDTPSPNLTNGVSSNKEVQKISPPTNDAGAVDTEETKTAVGTGETSLKLQAKQDTVVSEEITSNVLDKGDINVSKSDNDNERQRTPSPMSPGHHNDRIGSCVEDITPVSRGRTPPAPPPRSCLSTPRQAPPMPPTRHYMLIPINQPPEAFRRPSPPPAPPRSTSVRRSPPPPPPPPPQSPTILTPHYNEIPERVPFYPPLPFSCIGTASTPPLKLTPVPEESPTPTLCSSPAQSRPTSSPIQYPCTPTPTHDQQHSPSPSKRHKPLMDTPLSDTSPSQPGKTIPRPSMSKIRESDSAPSSSPSSAATHDTMSCSSDDPPALPPPPEDEAEELEQLPPLPPPPSMLSMDDTFPPLLSPPLPNVLLSPPSPPLPPPRIRGKTPSISQPSDHKDDQVTSSNNPSPIPTPKSESISNNAPSPGAFLATEAPAIPPLPKTISTSSSPLSSPDAPPIPPRPLSDAPEFPFPLQMPDEMRRSRSRAPSPEETPPPPPPLPASMTSATSHETSPNNTTPDTVASPPPPPPPAPTNKSTLLPPKAPPLKGDSAVVAAAASSSPKSPLMATTPYGKMVIVRSDMPLLSPEEEIRGIFVNAKDWGMLADHTDTLSLYTQLRPIIQQGPQCGLVALSMASQVCPDTVCVSSLLEAARERGFTAHGEMFSCDTMARLARGIITGLEATVRRDVLSCPHTFTQILMQGDLILVPYDAERNYMPGQHSGHKAHWGVVCGCLIQCPSLTLQPIRPAKLDSHVDNLWHLRPRSRSGAPQASKSRDTSRSRDGSLAPESPKLPQSGYKTPDPTGDDNTKAFEVPWRERSRCRSTDSDLWSVTSSRVTTPMLPDFNREDMRVLALWRQGKSRKLVVSPLEKLCESNDQLTGYPPASTPQQHEFVIGSVQDGLAGQVVVLHKTKSALSDLVGMLQEKKSC